MNDSWRKLHLGVDEENGEIVAAVVTMNDVADCEVLIDLLEQIDSCIEQVLDDDGYDTFGCYDTIAQRETKATIPPRSHAKIQQHGNSKAQPHPRDENLRRIRQVGRKQWKKVDITAVLCLKPLCFDSKSSLGDGSDDEVLTVKPPLLFLQCAALNRMIGFGKPNSYKVEDQSSLFGGICLFFIMQQSQKIRYYFAAGQEKELQSA